MSRALTANFVLRSSTLPTDDASLNPNDAFASDGELNKPLDAVRKPKADESSPFIRASLDSSCLRGRSYNFPSSSPTPRYVRGYDKLNSSPASFLDEDPEQAGLWHQLFTTSREASEVDLELEEVEDMLHK